MPVLLFLVQASLDGLLPSVFRTPSREKVRFFASGTELQAGLKHQVAHPCSPLKDREIETWRFAKGITSLLIRGGMITK